MLRSVMSAAAITQVTMKGVPELFDPFQGACGAALAEIWTDSIARLGHA
jgi:hypothetical protein